MTRKEILQRSREMRHAIDMLEGAMMGAGEMIDIPGKFEGARDDLLLMPKITLGQLRRITGALSECTRIINSEEYNFAVLGIAPPVSRPERQTP